jgi:hypothetical protein
MKITTITCSQCHSDENIEGIDLKELAQITQLDFNIQDAPVYKKECKNGHINYIFHINNKYEILYQLGVSAYHDQYFRESIINFIAAYERFNEYVLYALLDLENKEGFETTIENFKILSNSSEREFGAFTALFYYCFKKLPKPLEEYKSGEFKFPASNAVNFRNKVVHKGYIPNGADARKFAKAIALYIHEVLNIIHAEKPELIEKHNQIIRSYNENKYPKEINSYITYFTHVTIVDSTSKHMKDGSDLPFDEYIISSEQLQKIKK